MSSDRPACPHPGGHPTARPAPDGLAAFPVPESLAMNTLPACPACNSDLAYDDGVHFACPECGHEWSQESAVVVEETRVVRDANGTPLADGDSVTVIKDLKLKGSSLVVKVGTKIKNIRLVEGDHDIDCKIDGIGSMGLKSAFVRKA